MDTNTEKSLIPEPTKDKFLPDPVPPPPTHEAYAYDKITNKKTVVAQGTKAEMKWFVGQNRQPGKWLYMREINELDPMASPMGMMDMDVSPDAVEVKDGTQG
jgi:hypothetical protein